MSGAAARPAHGSLRRLLWPALASALGIAILLALGTWQLARRDWKQALIAQLDARAHGAAGEIAPESAWPAWDAAADEFRRVRLEGTFEHAKAVAVHGLLHDRPGRPVQGFNILTPLRRPDGSVVMINRGFVPTPLRDAALSPAATPVGSTIVEGLVRASERRGWFVPENTPPSWFVRDLAEIARVQSLARVAPFYVDQDAAADPNAWPRGGQTRLTLPDNHLQYALTWYGLAGALAAVFTVFARRRLAGSGDDLQADDARHDQPDAGQA